MVVGPLSTIAFGDLTAAGLTGEDVWLLVESVAARLRAEDVRLVRVLAGEGRVELGHLAAADRVARSGRRSDVADVRILHAWTYCKARSVSPMPPANSDPCCNTLTALARVIPAEAAVPARILQPVSMTRLRAR